MSWFTDGKREISLTNPWAKKVREEVIRRVTEYSVGNIDTPEPGILGILDEGEEERELLESTGGTGGSSDLWWALGVSTSILVIVLMWLAR